MSQTLLAPFALPFAAVGPVIRQPLCILGATGPELAYTVVFYKLCNALDLEFLPARVWQGLWTALFTVILAVTDGSAVMKMYTRFTEEIFSALISLIFIIEAFQKIFGGFYTLSLEGALLTTLLSLFTFWLAMSRKTTPCGRRFHQH